MSGIKKTEQSVNNVGQGLPKGASPRSKKGTDVQGRSVHVLAPNDSSECAKNAAKVNLSMLSCLKQFIAWLKGLFSQAPRTPKAEAPKAEEVDFDAILEFNKSTEISLINEYFSKLNQIVIRSISCEGYFKIDSQYEIKSLVPVSLKELRLLSGLQEKQQLERFGELEKAYLTSAGEEIQKAISDRKTQYLESLAVGESSKPALSAKEIRQIEVAQLNENVKKTLANAPVAVNS